MAGCSKDNDDLGPIDSIEISNPYKSKDSIHHYFISMGNLYKMKINDLHLVWKKPCTPPSPIVIDMGYGETKKIDFDRNYVVFDTDDRIFTLWATSEDKPRINIGLYDLSGDFVKNKEISLNYIGYAVKFIEMNDKNILIINSRGYTIIDKDINIIEDYSEKTIPYKKNLKFINNKRYITYDDTSITIFDLGTKETLDLDIAQFVKDKFPEEVNPPKYSILSVNISSNYVEATLKITLYNGKSESIIAKYNDSTGDLIK